MKNRLKFIQINIYKGLYLAALLDFLREEKPDIVSFQEVSAGCVNLCIDKTINLFEYTKNNLNMDGVFHKDVEILDVAGSFIGNAVFAVYPIIENNVVTLKVPARFSEQEFSGMQDFSQFPRHLLDVTCDFKGNKIHVLSWHGAWTAPPTDTEETLRQANMVAGYLQALDEPYILGGDLNAVIQSKTVGIINRVANNLMFNSGVLQTTHPKIHKIAPRGFLIDYVFCSKNFSLQKLEVPEVIVSDHLPIICELEI